MTVVSTPASRSRIAAVWRSTWHVTFLVASVGQWSAAVAVWILRRCSIASRLRRPPLRAGKTGSSD